MLAYYYGRGIDRVPVSYAQISPVMRQAIVAIEDARFYQHGAIDFKGTVRAVINNLEHKHGPGRVHAGPAVREERAVPFSPNPQAAFAGATSETIARKIRELRMAARVEHQMSKNAILAAYLNVAYFGSSAYGVEVAAERYFSTDASRLTLPQAALLAGLVENPTAYDPLNNPKAGAHPPQPGAPADGPGRHHHPGGGRRGEPGSRWGSTRRRCRSGAPARSARYAAFFCDYVLASMKVDPEFKQAWQRLNGIGGLKIYTTLDPKVQHAAQHAVNYMMPPPPSSVNPGKNAAAEVIVQPGTGKVRAIAIDRRYGYGEHRHRRQLRGRPAVQRRRGRADRLDRQGLRSWWPRWSRGSRSATARPWALPATVGGYTNCKGSPHPVAAAQRRERAGRSLQPVHRDDLVDQRVLRLPGAEGRPVQRDPHRRQDGPDLARREVAAEARSPGGATGTARTTSRRSRSARSTSPRSTSRPPTPSSPPAASTASRSRSPRS